MPGMKATATATSAGDNARVQEKEGMRSTAGEMMNESCFQQADDSEPFGSQQVSQVTDWLLLLPPSPKPSDKVAL